MGIAPIRGEGPAVAASLTSFVTDLLEAKFRAPRLSARLVRRVGLLSRLQDTRALPLVLMTTPAGYGKTTLLAQWDEQDERPFAWVTLDAGDSDPAVLTKSIASALRPTGLTEGGFVLVLDDAHVITPEVLRDAVLDVLDWLPEGCQLAVASRSEPVLPLSRMRAGRILIQLSADELSMSHVEGAALLASAGLVLDGAAAEDLIEQTEGWPVVLELAAASVSARGDTGQALAQLAGDDYLISEYFKSEILSGLSPATTRFLTRSSVLDRLSGPLCDAALDRSRSAGVLARLATMNVPLVPADPSHEWYRLNGPFREMLQTELRRGEPELEESLHRRAGDWLQHAGDLDRAVEHARDAGDLTDCGELLWANLPTYLGQGRNDEVQRWLSPITPEQASGSTRFALAAAHSHLARGSIALAEQWARSAMIDHPPCGPGGIDADRAGAMLVAAWAARTGAARMGQDAAQAYELLPDDSPWRATCCLLRGAAALLTGHASMAEAYLEEGSGRGAPLAADTSALCLGQLAVIALDRDDADLAADLAGRASERFDAATVSPYPSSALVFAVSAAAGVRQRRVDEAKAAASRCLRLIDSLDDFAPWYGAETRILLAQALLALGNVAGARQQLAEASRLARRVSGFVVFQRWFDDAWEQFDKRAETALIGAGSLTTAELRVLRFLPTHFSFHEIAARLHVSSNTVKTHVHAVYRKLDASSRSEAVTNATSAGLLG
ncbi:MAG: LuxR C-terminal-related transcriptional regulator [Solirubrobacteraceae bacterium]